MAFLLLLVCVSVSLLLCYYVLFRMDVYRTPTAVMVLQRLLLLFPLQDHAATRSGDCLGSLAPYKTNRVKVFRQVTERMRRLPQDSANTNKIGSGSKQGRRRQATAANTDPCFESRPAAAAVVVTCLPYERLSTNDSQPR
jgi:hypothetical protein